MFSTNRRLLTALAFESVPTTFEATPEGSISYQLHQKPVEADPPPKKRRYRISGEKKADEEDELKETVAFPPLPLALPETRDITESELQWPIDLSASQRVEARTRDQANSDEWCTMHTFVITSSNFGKILRNKNASESFIKAVFDSNLQNIPSIQHGKKFELTAVEAYLQRQSLNGKQVHFRRCGLVLHPQFRFLGASPDGLLCDSGEYGLLEVKCPHTTYVEKKTVWQAATENVHFCCGVTNGVLKLKQTHNYYCQVQGQMAICGAKWCDLFVWVGNDHFLERVLYDEHFWKGQLLPKLIRFYASSALPYLEEKNRPNVLNGHWAFPPYTADNDQYSQFETLLPPELCQS